MLRCVAPFFVYEMYVGTGRLKSDGPMAHALGQARHLLLCELSDAKWAGSLGIVTQGGARGC
jgi:hypothetical protein